jgi:hypothetical protein
VEEKYYADARVEVKDSSGITEAEASQAANRTAKNCDAARYCNLIRERYVDGLGR